MNDRRAAAGPGTNEPCLTIIVPTYDLHFGFAESLLESIDEHVIDPEQCETIVVVEQKNQPFVARMAARFPRLRISSLTTERIMTNLALAGSPADLLRHAGKFTFQSIKKIGAVLTARTGWVLAMDSESTFLGPFSARALIDDYRQRKYVFFTRVADRGPRWKGSLSEAVTKNAASLVGGPEDAWYLEYYHWFYESAVWRDIVAQLKSNGGFDRWMRGGTTHAIFENVLYYQHVKNHPALDYQFVDSLEALAHYLPSDIASRARQALHGDLQVVGLIEHVTSLLSVDELPHLEKLFSAFAMPFIRIEPYSIDPRVLETVRQFPSVRALVSSHRARVMKKRVAVCISGEFRSLPDNLRAVRDFTTGVACDLFVHGWNTPAIPAIWDALAPAEIAIEPAANFADLAATIAKPEPNAKPGRDAGSLAMFHGIAASIGAMADRAGEYDLVVRMRPDAVFVDSLHDLLVLIADDEAFDEDTIYVPDRFHSQGINDQFAIGSTAAMLRYGRIETFVTENIEREYFNPEHLMARHLLAEGIRLKTLPMHYVLLRSEKADPRRLGALLEHQNATWWSAPLPGPGHIRPATALFAAKAAAMEAMAARNEFGNASLLVSAEYLLPEAASLWRLPFLKIGVQRDDKNPHVCLVVDPATHGQTSPLYVDVQPKGLALSPHRPGGLLLMTPGRGGHDVDLLRFGDDLDRPDAVLTVSTHNPARVGQAAFTEPMPQPPSASRPVAIEGGTELMQHFLQMQMREGSGFWRSTRATLALRHGRSLRRKGDLLSARTVYAKALALDPARTREWVQYGHVLKDSGEPNEALAAYAMALALRPADPDAQFFFHLVQAQATAA